MSRGYKFHDQERPYFVTFSVVRWIDVFTRRVYRDILVDSLKYCIQNKGLELYAWVIMSNHVHLIIGTKGQPMQDILRDIKRHTLNGKGSKIQAMKRINFGNKEIILLNCGATLLSIKN